VPPTNSGTRGYVKWYAIHTHGDDDAQSRYPGHYECGAAGNTTQLQVWF
jgi:hypothetical protein